MSRIIAVSKRCISWDRRIPLFKEVAEIRAYIKRTYFYDTERYRKYAGRRVSLGVCKYGCSPLVEGKPMAYAWTSGRKASERRCMLCSRPLSRVSKSTWDGAIAFVDVFGAEPEIKSDDSL